MDRKTRHKRIRGKVSGNQQRPRLAVFRSTKHIYAQIIDDNSGKTLVAFSDLKIPKLKEERKQDLAKKVGLEIARLAKEKNIDKVVFDRGGYKYHGRVKMLAEGAREGGLAF